MIVPAAAAGNSLMEAPVDNGVLMESVSSVHLSSVHLQCPSDSLLMKSLPCNVLSFVLFSATATSDCSTKWPLTSPTHI